MPEEIVATENTQAEETEITETGVQPADGEQKTEKTVEEIQKEYELKLQSETDRRVNEALKKAQNKWQKEQEENDRLSKLTSDERERELMKKQQEEVEELKRNLQMKEVGYQIQDAILEEVLNPKVKALFKAEYYANQEDGMESLKNDMTVLKEIIQEIESKAIEKFKAEFLKGESPISTTGTTKTVGISKEEFEKLGYKERIELYNANPNLYEQLSKA